MTDDEIHYWDVKVYGDDGEEKETIRGITASQKITLMQLFDREGIQAQAIAYTEGGTRRLGESVNWSPGSRQ